MASNVHAIVTASAATSIRSRWSWCICAAFEPRRAGWYVVIFTERLRFAESKVDTRTTKSLADILT
jgi:hypothetical protein